MHDVNSIDANDENQSRTFEIVSEDDEIEDESLLKAPMTGTLHDQSYVVYKIINYNLITCICIFKSLRR